MSSDEPVVRQAQDERDRLAVLSIAHRANRSRQPLSFYQAQRLATPKRARGRWWLLELASEPVASLMCYPLVFGGPGRPLPGFGLGAVATLPEHQHKGLASRLCSEVAEHAAREGRGLGLLFAAIEPELYQRIGYRVAPAFDLECRRLAALRDSGGACPLHALDARRSAGALAALYEAAHRGLHLYRDESAFRESIADSPRDIYLGIGADLRGYARVSLESDDALEVLELCLVDEADAAPLLRALALVTLELERSRLHGWFPPHPGVSEFFADRGRARTLPMVKGTDAVAGSQFWPADYF